MPRRFQKLAWLGRLLVVSFTAVLLAGQTRGALSVTAQAQSLPPNILYIIMDDVGIDQMKLFGYGGETPPSTPNMDRIGHAGVRFANTWSMPACSTSRAAFFTGRFPSRTNVFGALGPGDLANSQVAPSEMTVPNLLKKKGYRNALFGKFHLGLQNNNPFGLAMPRSLGWDYYAGRLDDTGDPPSIDTTAGGVAAGRTTYSCGFVPSAADGGADAGACYSPSGACQQMTTASGIPPGRSCRDSGGIFDPGKSCTSPLPGYLDFTRASGHYVSPLVINHEDGRVEEIPSADPRARTFRAAADVDGAIEWINRQSRQTPWMATVSFASAHTPLVQPPASLLSSGAAATSGLDCANVNQQRILMNQMVEAIDTEIGRLLTTTGIARQGRDGEMVYDAAQSNTMVVIVGDNGALGSTVKPPFNPSRAKGTAYQTGVWVPLIVAGPLVKQPGRAVASMVNIVDLFQLFGEIAGIDVAREVPRPLDAAAMLPYLTNPNQGSLRKVNFTHVGTNIQANGSLNGPCQIASTCTQIPVTKTVCEDNAGIWWGQGATDPVTAGIPSEGLQYCCNVNAWLAARGKPTYTIQPLTSMAMRNDHFKIVQNFSQAYDAPSNSCVPTTTTEFYQIDERAPVPALDNPDTDLLTQPLTPIQARNYQELSSLMALLTTKTPACPGDGNGDGVVNETDRTNWQFYSTQNGGGSSWYDFNLDGRTDGLDLSIIQQNFQKTCPK